MSNKTAQRVCYGPKEFSSRNPIHIIGACSKEKAASALIFSGPCLITGIHGSTDGVNLVTLSIYDNTSAAGVIWDEVKIPGPDYHGGIIYPTLMGMDNGIYVALSGGSCKYYVFYAEIAD